MEPPFDWLRSCCVHPRRPFRRFRTKIHLCRPGGDRTFFDFAAFVKYRDALLFPLGAYLLLLAVVNLFILRRDLSVQEHA